MNSQIINETNFSKKIALRIRPIVHYPEYVFLKLYFMQLFSADATICIFLWVNPFFHDFRPSALWAYLPKTVKKTFMKSQLHLLKL